MTHPLNSYQNCDDESHVHTYDTNDEAIAAMTVRPMKIKDAPTISKLDKEYYPIEGGWSAAAFKRELKNPNCYFVVIENAGEIIAYAGAECYDGIGELTVNTVTTPYRHKGLGAKLLENRLEWLESKGVKNVFLHTREDNEPLIKLVTKYGFKKTKVAKGYYPNGVDALVMVRKSKR